VNEARHQTTFVVRAVRDQAMKATGSADGTFRAIQKDLDRRNAQVLLAWARVHGVAKDVGGGLVDPTFFDVATQHALTDRTVRSTGCVGGDPLLSDCPALDHFLEAVGAQLVAR
jgi:hypothetical protein